MDITRKADLKTVEGPAEWFTGPRHDHRRLPTRGAVARQRSHRPFRARRPQMAPPNIRTTIISPGAVKTERLDHISEKDVRQANQDYVGQIGVPAETLAPLVAFAINEPEDVEINEFLFRPTAQEL